MATSATPTDAFDMEEWGNIAPGPLAMGVTPDDEWWNTTEVEEPGFEASFDTGLGPLQQQSFMPEGMEAMPEMDIPYDTAPGVDALDPSTLPGFQLPHPQVGRTPGAGQRTPPFASHSVLIRDPNSGQEFWIDPDHVETYLRQGYERVD